MARIRHSDMYEDDEFEQPLHTDADAPTFQPLHKQTGKQVKGGERRKRDKEWGRSMAKYHKEKRKFGDGKP